MNTVIKTISQLKDAEVNAYIYSVIIAVVFILLLIIVANMISWKPGAKDNSGETRRTFFLAFSGTFTHSFSSCKLLCFLPRNRCSTF